MINENFFELVKYYQTSIALLHSNDNDDDDDNNNNAQVGFFRKMFGTASLGKSTLPLISRKVLTILFRISSTLVSDIIKEARFELKRIARFKE